MLDRDNSPIAPHRGFNAKAREVLLGEEEGMPRKAMSEFDIRKKLMACSISKKDTNTTSSPKSQSSTQSIPEHPTFDTIGEPPMVKKHKQLSQIGKTKSCMELKTNDKRLLKTYQEQNILKMPSLDSEFECSSSQVEPFLLDGDMLAKAAIYGVSEETKSSNVSGWIEKLKN